MKEEGKQDQTWSLAMTLTKAVLESTQPARPDENPLEVALTKLKDSRPLTLDDYDLFSLVLSKYTPSAGSIKSEEVSALIRFLEVLWLTTKTVAFAPPDRARNAIESVGKSALRVIAALTGALPTFATQMGYPKEIKRVERRLFEVYELYTSEVAFTDRAPKYPTIAGKIKKDLLAKLLTPAAAEVLAKAMPVPQPAKRIDEILLISSQQKPAFDLDPDSMCLPVDLTKIMNTLHIFATKDLELHRLWVQYLVTDSLSTGPLAESPQWSSDRSKSGWGSFNICILVLEEFAKAPGIDDLRRKLVETFIGWSRKALISIVEFTAASDSSKGELIATLYSAYLFPIFIFYGYLSRTDPTATLAGTELATDIVKKLIETDLKKVLTPANAEPVFSSLYFLFSYFCKQVGKHMMTGSETFVVAQKNDLVGLGLKLFGYIMDACGSGVPSETAAGAKKGGVAWDISLSPEAPSKGASKKHHSKKVPSKIDPSALGSIVEPPQEALDSLEEIVAMIGCLVGNCTEPNRGLVREWLASGDSFALVLKIVGAVGEIKPGGISGVVGKLVIELTQKDCCYHMGVWRNIIVQLAKSVAQSQGKLNGYLLALILKLGLCCYYQLERGVYPEAESAQIHTLWIEVIKSLFHQTAQNDPSPAYKEIAILFLLQTLLKPHGGKILDQIFIESLSSGSNPYERYLKVSAALPLETESMKVCSDLLGSVLLKGAEPRLEFMDFEKLDVTKAFEGMPFDTAKTEGWSLTNLVALGNKKGMNAGLFRQLLKVPRLIRYSEEEKMVSPDYYLSALLGMARTDPKTAAEGLQENVLALVQCYMGLEYAEPRNQTQLVYLQAIFHAYMLYLGTVIAQGAPLPSPQDVLEFLNLACDHALKVLDSQVLRYYQTTLAHKSDNLAAALKDLTLLCKDIKSTLTKLGLSDLDVSFLSQLSGSGSTSPIVDAVSTSFANQMKDPARSHEAFVDVLDTHFGSHFPTNEGAEEVSKMIVSTVLLLQALVKAAVGLIKVSGSYPATTLQALVRIDSVPISMSDHFETRNAAIEICKVILPSASDALHKTVSSLVVLENVCKSLRSVFTSPVPQKVAEILLELWVDAAKCVVPGTAEETAKEIAGYGFCDATKDVVMLLGHEAVPKETSMQILVSAFESAEKHSGKVVFPLIQERLVALPRGFFNELFTVKDPEYYLHGILGKVTIDCPELKRKLFDILADLVTASDNAGLTKHLELLSQIVESDRETYTSALLGKMLPFVQGSANEQMQSVVLNYLGSVSYGGLAVQYPEGISNGGNNNSKDSGLKQSAGEQGEETLEGYGVENFIKREEPVKPNATCSYMKTRRKNEPQPCYYCYTCNMTESKVCCAVCAKTCHKGHKVVFGRVAQMHCTCRSDSECISMPKDIDMFEGDHNSGYYLSQYKKYGFLGKEREWVADSLTSPPIHFPKFAEGPIKVRDKDRLKVEDADDNEDEESEISEDFVMEESVDSPEKNSEDQPAIVPTGASLALPPPVSANKSDGQQSPSERSFDDKSISVMETVLPPRDVPYEKLAGIGGTIPVINRGNKLTDKDVQVAQKILAEMCIKLMKTKAAPLVGVLLDAANRKQAKPEHSNEKLVGKAEKTVKGSGSVAQAKVVYDVMAPNAAGSKKGPPGGYSAEVPSSFRSYLTHLPTAKRFITTSRGGLMGLVVRDHVNIYNADLIASDAEKGLGSDKAKMPPISKVQMNFMICSAEFNEVNDSYLAVAGIRDCVVVTIDPSTGHTQSKLAVDLMLQAMGDEFTISGVRWVPKSQVHLAVAAHTFIKVYDLSSDNISPIYTINSTEAPIKDFVVVAEPQPTSYRFYAATGDAICTTVVEVPPKPADESNVDLVESVEYPENVLSILKGTHVVSTYFAPHSKLLFVTLTNGKIIYGELNPQSTKFKSSVVLSLGEDILSLHKFFYDLQEVSCTPTTLHMAAMSVTSSNQPQAVLFKLEENEASLQLLRQKVEGCHLFNPKGKSGKRILTPSDDAYVGSFAVAALGESPVNKKPLLAKPGEHAKLLERGKLPKVVNMPLDCLEKTSNVLDPNVNLSKKIKVGGTINLLVGKDNLALLEWVILGRGGNQFPVGIPPVTVDITLDAPEYVIAGIRIVADSAPKQFVNIFNRKVPLGTVIKSSTEIGFCDAETLSIENNTISFTLEATDTPIKLKLVEVFVQHKDAFGYFDKIVKLEQTLLKRPEANKGAEFAKFAPIISTKDYRILPWSEKAELLQAAAENVHELKAVVGGLEFLAATCYSSEPLPGAVADELLGELAGYMYMGIGDGIQFRLLRAAARKAAKAVIWNYTKGGERIEGDRFNYVTYKSVALFAHLAAVLKETIPFEALEKYMKTLGRIATRYRATFFDRISANLETLARISVILLEVLEKTLDGSETAADYKSKAKTMLEHYLTLGIGYFDLLLNTEWRKRVSKPSPHAVLEGTHIERIATLLGPYMLSKNEDVKSLLVSVLAETLPRRDAEYVHTCQSPVVRKYRTDIFAPKAEPQKMDLEQPVDLEIRSFDFSYALGVALAKYMLDRITGDSKPCVVTFAVLRELFAGFSNFAGFLRTVEARSDDDWAGLFCEVISTCILKKSLTNPAEKELILLGLKLFNLLTSSNEPPKGDSRSDIGKPKKGRTVRPLSSEVASKFLGTLYQTTGWLDWIANSAAILFATLKEKKGGYDPEPMQDIPAAPDKKAFLKVKQKSAVKGDWQLIFSGGEESAGATTETVEFSLFQELVKLCYAMAIVEQAATKAGKQIGGLLETKTLLKNPGTLKALKDILCEALLTPGLAAGLDSSAQQLFKMMSKNKGELNQYKDNYVYTLAFKALQETSSQSQPGYDQQLAAYKQLTGVWKVAKDRSAQWRQFAKNTPEFIKTLFNVASTSHDRIAFQALALVCLALEGEEHEGFHIKNSSEMLLKYPAHTLDVIDLLRYVPVARSSVGAECPPDVFAKGLEIAEKYALDSTSLHMRTVAAHLLRGLWDNANESQRELIFGVVSKKVTPDLYKYGCATLQLLTLCTCIFQSGSEKVGKYAETVLGGVIEGVKKATAIIKSHENAEIYREVQGMIVSPMNGSNVKPSPDREKEKRLTELLGGTSGIIPASEETGEFLYCLEEVPCAVCISDIGQPYSLQRIGDLKDDMKSTDSAYVYKLSNSYSVQKVSIRFELNDVKFVKTVNTYVSSAKEVDIGDLRGNWGVWKKSGSVTLKPRSRTAVVEFPIPVTTSLLMLEFITVNNTSLDSGSISNAPSSY